MTDHTSVIVDHLPECDFKGTASPCAGHQRYDARLRDGMWAHVCEYHFQKYAVGLGLGRGQLLITQAEADAQAAVDAAALLVLRDHLNVEYQDAFLAAHRALTAIQYGTEAEDAFVANIETLRNKRDAALNTSISHHPAGKGRDK
jgi:hypothetical protein